MAPPTTSSPATAAGYVRPSEFEVATSFVHGLLPATPMPGPGPSPRDALDDAIRPSLVDGPCHVTFSGGRDSSAVLAVATDLARREGLPPPVPVTRIYPDLPDTDESDWQRLVIDHLGLTDWLRLEVHEEHDLLGPAARDSLARRGMLWPPALHIAGHTYDTLDGGWILTGEGGDQTLGTRRISPLSRIVLAGRRPSRAQARRAGSTLLPRSARRRRMTRGDLTRQPWLRPPTLARHHELVAASETTQPLRYDRATWWIHRRRAWDVIERNHAILAADHGLRTANPLLDAGFLAALAHAGGRWGFPSRTATMEALFADLLPPALLARSSKARFNDAYAATASREFAREWDGTGVDPDLVDVDRLRREWLSEEPSPTTSLLMQAAWLRGRESAGAGDAP